MMHQRLVSAGLDFRLNQDRCIGILGNKPEDFQVSELHLSGLDARFSNIYTGGSGILTLGVLYKKGLSTFNAIKKLAIALGIRVEDIGYGGLKDAKALTWQFITLPGKIGSVELDNTKFFPLSHRNSSYSSKEVWGNSFQVCIKNMDERERVLKEFYRLTKTPLPAFYGAQRFGANSLDTHLIGLCLLKQEYEEAIKTILHGRNGSYEKLIEKRLREGRTEKDAIFSLPRRLITLFVNAYQASVFNRALKTHIKENGSLVATHGIQYVGLVDRFGLPSKIALLDTSKIQAALSEKRVFIMCPLPGTRLAKLAGGLADLERVILGDDGISVKDFQRTLIGEVSGDFRQTCFWIEEAKHALHNEEVTLRFKLQKGMYASVVMQELLV